MGKWMGTNDHAALDERRVALQQRSDERTMTKTTVDKQTMNEDVTSI